MYRNAAEHDERNDGLHCRCEELRLVGGRVGGLGEVPNRKSGNVHGS